MIMNKQSNPNGVNTVIDALLMRMSELDRFSDDEYVLTNKDLLPFDVVTSKSGQFGFIGGNVSIGNVITEQFRTIYETEGVAARAYLVKYFGDKQWL